MPGAVAAAHSRRAARAAIRRVAPGLTEAEDGGAVVLAERFEHDAQLIALLHFNDVERRPVENHVLAVPPSVVGTLPTRLQELLGYNIYPPFMGYVDGRHPDEVRFTRRPEDDVQRRDFTINGLMYDPVEERVLDFVGGQADIRARRLRTIRDPSPN